MSTITKVGFVLLLLFSLVPNSGCTRHYYQPNRQGTNIDVPGVHVHVPTRSSTNVHVGRGGVQVGVD